MKTAQGEPVDVGGMIIAVIAAWTQENFLREEAQDELEGELRAKITIIEKCLKANMSWETITEATQIDQELFQSMKGFYSSRFSAIITDAEYMRRCRSMIVYFLNFQFELSDVERIPVLNNLASVTEREKLDSLVNTALIVEDLDEFHDSLSDLSRSGEFAEIIC